MGPKKDSNPEVTPRVGVVGRQPRHALGLRGTQAHGAHGQLGVAEDCTYCTGPVSVQSTIPPYRSCYCLEARLA